MFFRERKIHDEYVGAQDKGFSLTGFVARSTNQWPESMSSQLKKLLAHGGGISYCLFKALAETLEAVATIAEHGARNWALRAYESPKPGTHRREGGQVVGPTQEPRAALRCAQGCSWRAHGLPSRAQDCTATAQNCLVRVQDKPAGAPVWKRKWTLVRVRFGAEYIGICGDCKSG
jgi:hypothetical protein